VFYIPRSFSRDEFTRFVTEQSHSYPETIQIARDLSVTGRYWLCTLNNESDELNRFRIQKFGLRGVFDAFLSSCWLGLTKPTRRFYERAVAISQCVPEDSVFIDDREQNLVPARALGMNTILYQSADQLGAELTELGVTTIQRG
jgi:putative hydrolase of the HAD superfamily